MENFLKKHTAQQTISKDKCLTKPTGNFIKYKQTLSEAYDTLKSFNKFIVWNTYVRQSLTILENKTEKSIK